MVEANVHIGKLIKWRVSEVGISKAALARRLCMSPANVYKIFRRRSIDSAMLYKLGVILGCDFFKCYTAGSAGPERDTGHLAALESRIEMLEQRLKELSA